MIKVVQDVEASNENAAGGSLLDQIVRDGAKFEKSVLVERPDDHESEGHRQVA